MRNNKKGFTIVELVIVIAVIAILAAVMIPTFGGIIEKANKSSVEQTAQALYKQAIALDLADGTQDGYEGAKVAGNEDNKIDEIEKKPVTYTVTTDENGNTVVTFSYTDDAKGLTAKFEAGKWTVAKKTATPAESN